MKRPAPAVAGILLAACCLVVLSVLRIGRADNPNSTMPNWRLGAPVTHENLTIFPVLSDNTETTDEFITLDEGLRSGTVIVKELSGDGTPIPARRMQRNAPSINPAQQQVNQSGDSAQVNKVVVTNNSGKTLVLIAGEVILGGKQDRIVGHDCIVAATGQPVPIDVFCVEHGRWQETSLARRQTSGEASAGGGAAFHTSDKGVMAAPKVRANAQAAKSQSAVWAEVADKVSKNNVSTTTGTLNSVYEDKKIAARLDEYERSIKAKLTAPNAVGAVIAVNGKIISADVFANPSLFQAYWTKLLKSYALEALSAEKTTRLEVKTSDAEAFLSRSTGTGTSIDKDGVYRVSEKQSDADASFELEHTGKSGKLIHFNRVSKK